MRALATVLCSSCALSGAPRSVGWVHLPAAPPRTAAPHMVSSSAEQRQSLSRRAAGAAEDSSGYVRMPLIRSEMRGASRPWRLPVADRVLLARVLRDVHNNCAAVEGEAAAAVATRRVWDAFVFATRSHRAQFRKSQI